jgi:uncharacterized protein YPO0396
MRSMDDITNKRFDNVDKKIDAVEERLGRRIDGLSIEMQGLAQETRDGFAAVRSDLRDGIGEVMDRLSAEGKKHHAEQMGRFDTVIQQAEKLGVKLGKLEERAEGERDRRIAVLETENTQIRAELVQLRTMLVNFLGATKQ